MDLSNITTTNSFIPDPEESAQQYGTFSIFLEVETPITIYNANFEYLEISPDGTVVGTLPTLEIVLLRSNGRDAACTLELELCASEFFAIDFDNSRGKIFLADRPDYYISSNHLDTVFLYADSRFLIHEKSLFGTRYDIHLLERTLSGRIHNSLGLEFSRAEFHGAGGTRLRIQGNTRHWRLYDTTFGYDDYMGMIEITTPTAELFRGPYGLFGYLPD